MCKCDLLSSSKLSHTDGNTGLTALGTQQKMPMHVLTHTVGLLGPLMAFRVVAANKCLDSHPFQGFQASVRRSALADCEGANEFPEQKCNMRH